MPEPPDISTPELLELVDEYKNASLALFDDLAKDEPFRLAVAASVGSLCRRFADLPGALADWRLLLIALLHHASGSIAAPLLRDEALSQNMALLARFGFSQRQRDALLPFLIEIELTK